jgi:hypothetical protein
MNDLEKSLRKLAQGCSCLSDSECIIDDRPCKVMNDQRCRYFEQAVLPADERLQIEYWKGRE